LEVRAPLVAQLVVGWLLLEFQDFLAFLGGFRWNCWRSLVLLANDVGLLLVQRGRLSALRLARREQRLVRVRALGTRVVQQVGSASRALRCQLPFAGVRLLLLLLNEELLLLVELVLGGRWLDGVADWRRRVAQRLHHQVQTAVGARSE
jgi:hypothetical protein